MKCSAVMNPASAPRSDKHVVVIGAGPAGLTAAYQLGKANVPVTVLEADPTYVGGISRTVKKDGYHFDIGGHRFFSKAKEIEDLWTEILPDDMLVRPRSSRIYYGGKFYSYPLDPLEALINLGPVEALRCVASYAAAQLRPVRNPKSFEDWVVNHFGERLYSIFFKTYTEKVWGMSCRDISADWAAQRIQNLSLVRAVLNGFTPQPKERRALIKTLIGEFRYPRKGPGMMWEACAGKVREMGGRVELGRRVEGLRHEGSRWSVTHHGEDGSTRTEDASHVISTAPLREVVANLEPRPSSDVLAAARALRYRDFLVVALMVVDRGLFQDNWVYIQDPGVKVGRIQNFRSWSPEMVPEERMTCYGLEYFCFEGDGLWASSDEELVELAKRELCDELGLALRDDIESGCVVRVKKAYPVYDDDYADHVLTIRNAVSEHYPGLHFAGRNGMHKYNNQDHAMMTAMLTVENILAGTQRYDIWSVNQDAEYHEANKDGSRSSTDERLVPRRARATGGG
jgi:protoporphyrinogen oxidase